MQRRFLKLALLLPCLLVSLHAGVLAGDTVNVAHYYPDFSRIDYNMGNQVVPTGAFSYHGTYEVVVTDTTITMNSHCGGCSWSGGTFNGPVITDLTNAPITSVSIDASTNYAGFDASRVSFDGSHVGINVQGLSGDGFIQLDLNTGAVPEPGTMGLLGMPLIGLAYASRRFRR